MNPFMNYPREEQLNIPSDDKNRTITISKIFNPTKTNPIYKFILENSNGQILPLQFYNDPDAYIRLIKDSKLNTKEITISYSYDLDLCFIKLYLNM